MISDADLQHCLDVLTASQQLAPDDPRFLMLENAAAHLRKHAKKRRRLARKQTAAAADRRLAEQTQLAREREVGPASDKVSDTFHRERRCYVCKQPYRQVHARYHRLCPTCGDQSQAARTFDFDLTGRRALVTGARIKIGFQVALELLRAGAHVIATTRFPQDAAKRYAAQPDFELWSARLELHGLDFRELKTVMGAIDRWAEDPLDILINNAAQTVWHPPEYYQRLWAGEAEPKRLPVTTHQWADTPPAQDGHAAVALLSNQFGDPLDLRRTNSWVQTLAEVPPAEMVECQVVNSMVPYLLCSRLKPAFDQSPFRDRYIVNVTAVEGQFGRPEKRQKHPHTNMAKAALNMLTATSASDYAGSGIYMVSVDPGWMSHEAPHAQQEAMRATGFHPPLDATDCAARILDPIGRGLSGAPVYGVLLKDFAEAPW